MITIYGKYYSTRLSHLPVIDHILLSTLMQILPLWVSLTDYMTSFVLESLCGSGFDVEGSWV